MFGGILIGIGVTALAFFVAWLLRGGSRPSPIVYLLMVVALVILCVESVLMVKANRAKNDLRQQMTLVQETIMAYLPQQSQDYTLTAEQASAVRLGLGLIIPSAVENLGTEDFEGKTVIDITNMLRLHLEKGVTKQVRKIMWILIISAIVLILLFYLTYAIPIGGMQYGKKTLKNPSYSSSSNLDDF